MRHLLSNQIARYFLFAFFLLPAGAYAQGLQGRIPNIRPYDKTGINVFETVKTDTIAFAGPTLRIGAAFTQEFQNLRHSNNSEKVPGNSLYGISPGFNTAMANLYTDLLLTDGIHLNMTIYLSTRHHNEAWVKGGYLQFDKLPFKGEFWKDLMKYTTIRIGHMEINYGDAHYRRTDAGQAIYNPFTESYIIDGYGTEIGGEVYYQRKSFIGMIGMTSGMIKGSVDSAVVNAANGTIRKNPAIYGKIGIDKQFSEKGRLRLTGSYYHIASSPSNDLYNGDRAGSNYFMVMEKPYVTPPSGTGAYEADGFSGRLNPGLAYKVDAVMINGFAKYAGFEFFGTLEHAQGRSNTETSNRQFTQYAVDGIYRFGKSENLFIGARYNNVLAELKGIPAPVTIERVAYAAGWFLTKNILLKGEYVTQNYKDFPATDVRNSGKFEGYVIAATIGF